MNGPDARAAARAAGLCYLGMGLAGLLGFVVLRPRLYAADPVQALANLSGQPGLARTVVLLDLVVVVAQALTAVAFFRLLRPSDPVAAYATATFGAANALAVLLAAVFTTTATSLAADPRPLAGLDPAGAVGLLLRLSEAAWGVGSVFFGLWLVPMGWVAFTSGLFPRVLGGLLVAGGAGYVLSALLGHGVAGVPAAFVGVLVLPATVGEFWMIGHLLVVGMRPVSRPHAVAPSV